MFNREKIKELKERIEKLETKISCLEGYHASKYEYCSYLRAVVKKCSNCGKRLEEYQLKQEQQQ